MRQIPFLKPPASKKLYCPICEKEFSEFLPFGKKKRPNVACPECGSSERHRFIYLFLKRKTPLFKKRLNIFYASPENCFLNQFKLFPKLNCVTFDIGYHRNIRVRGNVERLPFKSASFDAVLCLHVLEHVRNDLEAMHEMLRILKPGGWAILQSPVGPQDETLEDLSLSETERAKLYGHPEHLRLYGNADYLKRIKQTGFEVTVDRMTDFVTPEMIKTFAMQNNNEVFYCVKPIPGLFSRVCRKLLSFV